jgi:hypothetical protein
MEIGFMKRIYLFIILLSSVFMFPFSGNVSNAEAKAGEPSFQTQGQCEQHTNPYRKCVLSDNKWVGSPNENKNQASPNPHMEQGIANPNMNQGIATPAGTPESGGISSWIKGGLKALGVGKGPTEPVPALDSSAAPIGEGGVGGGPAGQDER